MKDGLGISDLRRIEWCHSPTERVTGRRVGFRGSLLGGLRAACSLADERPGAGGLKTTGQQWGNLGRGGGLPVGRCIRESTGSRSEARERRSYRPGGRPDGGYQGATGWPKSLSRRAGIAADSTERAGKMRARERLWHWCELSAFHLGSACGGGGERGRCSSEVGYRMNWWWCAPLSGGSGEGLLRATIGPRGLKMLLAKPSTAGPGEAAVGPERQGGELHLGQQ